jgi:hypothetical protein
VSTDQEDDDAPELGGAEETTDEKAPLERDGRYIRGFAIRLGQALIAARRSDYEIGRFVDEAMLGRYWERWHVEEGRTPSFTVWCDKVLGFRSRKAEYLRKNYLGLVAINPPEDLLVRALRLGWTKLSLVLRVAKTTETLQGWLDRIETYAMSEEEVNAEVRLAVASLGKDGDESEPPAPDTAPPAARTKENIIFDNPEDLRLWTNTRGVIKERFNITGKGQALGLLCTAYLAALPRTDEGGVAAELDYLAMHISRTYGKRVVLLDADATAEGSAEKLRVAKLALAAGGWCSHCAWQSPEGKPCPTHGPPVPAKAPAPQTSATAPMPPPAHSGALDV